MILRKLLNANEPRLVERYSRNSLRRALRLEILDQRRLLAADVLDVGVLYDNSAFSGAAAIAPDKTPYRFGDGAATFENYTSYSAGINAITVDIANLAGTPTAADFTFKVGNDQDPSAWADAPAPASIDVDAGAGVEGSSRVTIRWSDNAIQNQWLQVTVLANANTGLNRPDTFYWGNQIGETGNAFGRRAVDFDFDELTTVDTFDSNPVPENASGFNPIAIDNVFDINRDGRINVVDHALIQANATLGTSLEVLDFGTPVSEGFQFGVDGYNGTLDTVLLQIAPGGTFANEVNIPISDSSSEGAHGLIRFEDIFGDQLDQVPSGAVITNATVTLFDLDGASNTGLALHRMLTNWGANSSWLSLVNGVSADGIEAAEAATDVILGPNGEISFDVTLDVQAWSGGVTNLGWAILGNPRARDISIPSSQAGNPAVRPLLSIDYLPIPGPTATFRDGFNGYDGTVDIHPRQESPDLETGDVVDISADFNSPTDEEQALIRFDGIFGSDPGQVPIGSQITKASVTFTTNSRTVDNISFHRMLTAWDNTSTWNTLGGGVQEDDVQAVATPTAILVAPQDPGGRDITPATIDVTSDVQLWADGTADNFGWVALNDGSDGWDFWSSEFDTTRFRPLLTIEYEPPIGASSLLFDDRFCVPEEHEPLDLSKGQLMDMVYEKIGQAQLDASSRDGARGPRPFSGDGVTLAFNDRIVGPSPRYLAPVVSRTAMDLNAISVAFALDDGSEGSSTLSFRDGVDGYDNTLDINPRENQKDLITFDDDDISVDLADPSPFETQALLRFEEIFGDGAGQIPFGSAILNATVTFDTNSRTNGDIYFHRMLTAWDNDSTWNTLGDGVTRDGVQSATDPTTIAGLDGDIENGPLVVSLTADVQAYSDGVPNLGWAMFNTSGDGWDFWSSERANVNQRPVLTIEFAGEPAVQATGVSLDGTAWDTDPAVGVVDTPNVKGVTANRAFPTGSTVIDIFGAAADSFVSVAANQPIVFVELDLSSRVPGDTVELTPNVNNFSVAIGPNLAPIDVSNFVNGTLTVTELGDANGDGELNNNDIDAFIQALVQPAEYAVAFPAIDVNSVLDMNGDGIFNNNDLDAWISALFN